MKLQKGFGVVETVIAVVVIAVLGFIVWRIMDSQQNGSNQNQAQQTEQTVPAVEDAAGLEKAETFLDSADVDGQLDTKDINAVLE